MADVLEEKKQLVVPASIQRKAGIKAGDRLEFKASRGVITILPKLPSADDEYTPEQRRIIDARLAESEEGLQKGRTYGPFNTVDDHLDGATTEEESMSEISLNADSGGGPVRDVVFPPLIVTRQALTSP